jgi:hypothetical protein
LPGFWRARFVVVLAPVSIWDRGDPLSKQPASSSVRPSVSSLLRQFSF